MKRIFIGFLAGFCLFCCMMQTAQAETINIEIRNFNFYPPDPVSVSEQTVKKELVGMFDKLGVKNRTQAAVRGVELGLSGLAAAP